MNDNSRIAIETLPECAFFAIIEEHFHRDSWKQIIDMLADHGMYNLLTVTMRVTGHPVTEPETINLFKRLVDYANQRGFGVAIDLDPRLARAEFQRRYPNELQKIVYLRKIPVSTGDECFTIEPDRFTDHMTGKGTPYKAINGCFVKALSYKLNQNGEIIPKTLVDVSELIKIDSATGEGVSGCLVKIDAEANENVVVMAEFSLFTPDVFSPNILTFQRKLLELYADLPLKGVIKDEWGFPPTRPVIAEANAFWYSRFYADAYSQTSCKRILLDDLLLMSVPFENKDEERLRSINHYRDLNYRRNAEIETCYYHDVKSVFGPEAFIGKHATWFPRINEREIFKNGLVWWAAKRDWGQTDEITPLSACTALSKKFNSANWLNEGYSDEAAHYRRNIWRYAAAGGRMVFHPLIGLNKKMGELPMDEISVLSHGFLLSEELICAQCRVRLLNFISKAPLDCPVAFVFSHPNIMNWAGDGFLDYGEELSLNLWRNGYAVDLYPSSEIMAGTFSVDKDGYLRVGPQKYQAMVFYNPDMCQTEIADFFTSSGISQTKLFMKGTWNRDFKATPFTNCQTLKKHFTILNDNNALKTILSYLKEADSVKQPPLSEPFMIFRNNQQIGIPAPEGITTLLDGTVIKIAACRQSDAGDPINETISIGDASVKVKAEGLFAARIGANGNIEALAAGGLTIAHGAGISLQLERPLDLAIWRNKKGQWSGVLQGLPDKKIPAQLKKITADWKFISIPPSFPNADNE